MPRKAKPTPDLVLWGIAVAAGGILAWADAPVWVGVLTVVSIAVVVTFVDIARGAL